MNHIRVQKNCFESKQYKLKNEMPEKCRRKGFPRAEIKEVKKKSKEKNGICHKRGQGCQVRVGQSRKKVSK
jgi:hypothetical protein